MIPMTALKHWYEPRIGASMKLKMVGAIAFATIPCLKLVDKQRSRNRQSGISQ